MYFQNITEAYFQYLFWIKYDIVYNRQHSLQWNYGVPKKLCALSAWAGAVPLALFSRFEFSVNSLEEFSIWRMCHFFFVGFH